MEIYDFGGSRSKAPAGVPTNSKVAEICQDLLTDPYLQIPRPHRYAKRCGLV